MNTYDYWKWDSFLSAEQCDAILRERAGLEETKGTVKQERINSPAHRDSHVAWLTPGHWLEGALFNLGRHANILAGWNFTIGYPEQVQLAKYGVGQYYKDHGDCIVTAHAVDMRKISVVALLSEPSAYAGGEFFLTDIHEPIPLTRGSIIVFPSLSLHRVEPVTAGERFSAVCWVWGPK